MKKAIPYLTLLGAFVAGLFLLSMREAPSPHMMTGNPGIKSISAMHFSPEGVLFIGDSRSAKVIAIEMFAEPPYEGDGSPAIKDIDAKIAALLGTKPASIMIHDMVVHPISKDTYIAVSREGEKWGSEFYTPNDLVDAKVLLKVTPEGEISEYSLKNVSYTIAELPNPISSDKKHAWKKGVNPRVDAITAMAYHENRLYVSGLSNEEFASTMYVLDYPLGEVSVSTSLEIFHGAHGKYETKSPVRAFVPYHLAGQPHLIAAYLCTPLVTFPTSDIESGSHIMGKTVAELGSGNYPTDMVIIHKNDKDVLIISNSNRTMMHIEIEDIPKQVEGLAEKSSTMTGVPYIPLTGGVVYQMAVFDERYVLTLRRGPNGRLKLDPISIRWL